MGGAVWPTEPNGSLEPPLNTWKVAGPGRALFGDGVGLDRVKEDSVAAAQAGLSVAKDIPGECRDEGRSIATDWD